MLDDRGQRQHLGDKGMGGNKSGKRGRGQDHVGWQGNGRGSGRDEGEGEGMHVLEGLRGLAEGGGDLSTCLEKTKGAGKCRMIGSRGKRWVTREWEGMRQGKWGRGQDHVGWQGHRRGSGREKAEGDRIMWGGKGMGWDQAGMRGRGNGCTCWRG